MKTFAYNHCLRLLFQATGILVGCSFFLLDSYAQRGTPLQPEKQISQYVHNSWTVDNGLPQNSVSSLVQSWDGYLWFGTEEGLVRYDGVQFTSFDKQVDSAFGVNDIVTVLKTRQGEIWAGTRGAGIVIYNGTSFRVLNDSTGLASNFITALSEDRDGTIWIGTYGGGLARYAKNDVSIYGASKGFSAEFVSEIVQDQGGVIWAGSEQGIFRLDNDSFVRYEGAGLGQAFITTLYPDNTGRMWIATRESGLFVWSADSFTQQEHTVFKSGYVTSMIQDQAGSVWMGMTGGTLVRSTSESIESSSDITQSDILGLLEDREGTLWIGTRGDGLHQLRNSAFTPYSTPEGLSSNRVYTIYEQEAEGMWVGTAQGLNLIKDNRVVAAPLTDPMAEKEILAITGGFEQDLWIGTYGEGLFQKEGERFHQYTTAEGLPSNNVFALTTDSKGRVWVGTDAGVGLYDGERFSIIDTTQGLPSQYITAFSESQDGAMWIGTYDAGLTKYNQKVLQAYNAENGLSTNGVLALHEDNDGVLWIGTYGGGLNRLRANAITSYSTDNGFYNDNVYVILEDDENHLWMTCNKGVFRVDKAVLNQIARGNQQSILSTVFGKTEGLRSAETTGGQQPAGWKSNDGMLWFPTIEGVASINPYDLQKNSVKPTVILERLIVDYESINLFEEIELAAGAKKLQFKFTAPSFVVPERVLFQFMLDGVDEEWSEPNTRRDAFYTNLSPGNYTFKVRAANNDGVWSETAASISFNLQPHFYQTLWFRSIAVLSFLLMGLLFYRVRIQQLKKQQENLERIVEERTRDLRLEKEKTEASKKIIEAQAAHLKELDRFKTRFFANISHEFRTPLTMIIGPLENALSGIYGPLEGKLNRQIGIMLRNAQRLLRLINQLLDLSKIESGKMELRTQQRNIVAFLEGVLLSCTSLADKKEISLTFESPRDEIKLYFEPDKLEKVFFNLLSNALKFTPNGGVISLNLYEKEPSSEFEEGSVEIHVIDTGRGIPEEDLPHIFDRFHQVDGSNTREFEGTGIGLALVQELVLLHKGKISVRSTMGTGTSFIAQLPLGHGHLNGDQILTDSQINETMSPSSVHVISELAYESTEFDHEDSTDQSVQDSNLMIASNTAVIVEDNYDVREYVSSILSPYLVVHTAEDGLEGLEIIKEIKPDLVISDVMMPRMDGNELCSRIKDDPELNHIPVILMTARATNELRIEGLEIGADDYLTKPFNARELLVRARNLMLMRYHEKELKLLNDNLEQQVAQQLELMMRERLKYEEELVTAKEKAEASSRLKSIILDNFNHEFRTPLTGILGSVEILDMEADPSLQEFVDYIKNSSHRLQHTLDAVLELSALENETHEYEREALNLNTIVGVLTERYTSAAADKGLQFTVTAGDQEVVVMANEFAIQRILHHIIDNAIKFTNEGHVQVTLEQSHDTATVSVQDSGIGISKVFMPHVFDAFVQESHGISRTYEGMGIGLTIAKRLSEHLDGEIHVSSVKKEGTTIQLLLPLHAPEAQSQPLSEGDAAASE